MPESLSVGLTPPGGVSNSASSPGIGAGARLSVSGAEQRWQMGTPSGFGALQRGQFMRRKPSEE
jgi:hypothetical protein